MAKSGIYVTRHMERRAARRSAAHSGLDMPLRKGEGAASRVVRGEGLGTGGLGRLRGLAANAW